MRFFRSDFHTATASHPTNRATRNTIRSMSSESSVGWAMAPQRRDASTRTSSVLRGIASPSRSATEREQSSVSPPDSLFLFVARPELCRSKPPHGAATPL